MGKNYHLFDYKTILEDLKKEENPPRFKKFIDEISVVPRLEDLSLYKDYLSKFEMEQDFDCYALSAQKDSISKDDLYLLFRLICAWDSCTYTIVYDKEPNAIDFQVTAPLAERTVTKKVQQLSDSQINKMYRDGLKILFLNEVRFSIKETDESGLDTDQMRLLKLYKKKVRIWHDLMESEKILSEMDELLYSESI